MDRTLQLLRRRLEKAELAHLRRHCTELSDRLEVCEERALAAENMAEYYYDQHLALIHSITMIDDVDIGITRDGAIGIIGEAA